MHLNADVAGLESLPLRLMIVAVVASMSVVPAARMLDTLEDKEFVDRAKLQLENIVAAAQLLSVEGPGGVRTLSLDFSGRGDLRFRSLVLGGESGSANMSSVQLLLSSGSRILRTATAPEVWLVSPEGAALEVSSPVFELRLSALLAEGQLRMQAEAS